MAGSVMQEICYFKECVKLIDVNILNIWDLYLKHSHGLWSWKKMRVLRKCSLGLQSYSGGIFVPPPLSSAVGNIWPSYCFALPAQGWEHVSAVCVSGQVLTQKGNGGTERGEGSLHMRGRSGTPASPVAPCSAGLQAIRRRGTAGRSRGGRDLPHRPCTSGEEKGEGWVSISPRPVHFYMQKTRNHDSDDGSYHLATGQEEEEWYNFSIPTGSCQHLVPNSGMQDSEVKYLVLFCMTELCMERGKKPKPTERHPQHGKIHSHWIVGWLCLDVCRKLVPSYHYCLLGEAYFI